RVVFAVADLSLDDQLGEVGFKLIFDCGGQLGNR
nr:hypothetical protein [Chlamydiota bacterium]